MKGFLKIFPILISLAALGATIWFAWAARKTTKQQMRAYLAFDAGNISVVAESYKVFVQFKNGGQSPAYFATRSINATVSKSDEHDYSKIEFFRSFLRETAAVPNADVLPQAPVETSATFQISADQLKSVRSHEQSFFVGAVVKYRDTFQRCQVAAVILKSNTEDPLGKWKLNQIYSYSSDPEFKTCKDRDGSGLKAVWP